MATEPSSRDSSPRPPADSRARVGATPGVIRIPDSTIPSDSGMDKAEKFPPSPGRKSKGPPLRPPPLRAAQPAPTDFDSARSKSQPDSNGQIGWPNWND